MISFSNFDTRNLILAMNLARLATTSPRWSDPFTPPQYYREYLRRVIQDIADKKPTAYIVDDFWSH